MRMLRPSHFCPPTCLVSLKRTEQEIILINKGFKLDVDLCNTMMQMPPPGPHLRLKMFHCFKITFLFEISKFMARAEL